MTAELNSKTSELARTREEVEHLSRSLHQHEARQSSVTHAGAAASISNSAGGSSAKGVRPAQSAPAKIMVSGVRELLLPALGGRRTSDEDEYVTADESFGEEGTGSGEDQTGLQPGGAEAHPTAPTSASRRTIRWHANGLSDPGMSPAKVAAPTTPTVSEALLEVEQAILKARTISMASNPRSPRFTMRSPRYSPGQRLTPPQTTPPVRVADN